MSRTPRARAHGKVNLSLRVGPLGADGYHPLTSVFQAVALAEEVVATPGGAGVRVTVCGPDAERVPTDHTNLAWRAAELLAGHIGIDPDVHLQIVKGVPVAGGMAGGSADAAAALVACDALWQAGLSRDTLIELAGQLGSDVPFCLLGHTAVGTGRGQRLTPALARGEFHWAFALQAQGLSTPSVYRRFDELTDRSRARPGASRASASGLAVDVELMHALRRGDPVSVGKLLHNDLQPAALSLRPELGRTLALALEAGALGAVVAGSGPTVAALARGAGHALAICAAWTTAGACAAVRCSTAPAPGARVIS